jgi:hypothetical protein
MIGLTTRCSFLGRFLTALAALWLFAGPRADADSPVIKYRPEVGKTYDYGIECVVIGSGNPQWPYSHRCRLEFKVTAADEEHWEAEYATSPVVKHLGVIHRPPGAFPKLPASTEGLPPHVAQMAAAAQARREHEETELAGLPLLLGTVWSVPLIRLPEADSGKTYSSRDETGITIARAGVVMKSEMFFINSFTRSESANPNLFAAKRSIELAGGTTAEQTLRASGDGKAEFSLLSHMPESGSIDVKSTGISYGGRVDDFMTRLAFQRLNDWQSDLFNLYLLPTEEGLDGKNLPRLNEKVTSTLIELTKQQRPNFRSHLSIDLAGFAPPAEDAALYKAVAGFIAKVDRLPKNDSNRELQSLSKELNTVFLRWQAYRRVAMKVPRQWSDSSGSFRVRATLVSRTTDSVKLKRLDKDATINVPLTRLSPADQEIAKTFGKLEPSL